MRAPLCRGSQLIPTLCLLGGTLAAQQPPSGGSVKPGEKHLLNGRPFFVERVEKGRLVLTPPQPPTQSLGAFVTPVDAQASDSQSAAGRTPLKLIDGSGWGESFPGSGVYVHSADVYEQGSCMWNGAWDAWLLFDLGQERNLAGFYVWNYNEGGGWETRGVKEFGLSASRDGQAYVEVGNFTLAMAPARGDYEGQTVAFDRPVRARFVKWQIMSNYRGGEMSGLSEVRFADADRAADPPTPPDYSPRYPRPEHPALKLGQPLAGAENVLFPPDAGVVDVTQAPYGARGDGLTDDTATIQRALDDHPNQGAVIYLPNGMYLISDTLRWPHGADEGAWEKRTVLQGQSREGTVVRLLDDCPGFEDPRRPKALIWTGERPAQRFGNEVRNLTVDTGVGNPGACGVQFIANNQGGMYDVTVVSGDGHGSIGLDMGYTDEQGPCLVKRVRVVGFEVGIRVATSVASEVLEHIVLEQQTRFGLRNDGQPCTIRDLRSTNEVPAVRVGSGFTVLLDSVLEGVGAASGQPAITNDGALIARNVRTTGYRVALENHAAAGPPEIAGPTIGRFLSKPGCSLFDAPEEELNLPVRETPEAPWDPPESWIAPQAFGAVADDGRDDTPALQAAIDSGATTVYLPRGAYHLGGTVILRGSVRRLIGCKAWLSVIEPLASRAAPLFRFENGAEPTVWVEWIDTDFGSGPYCFLEHAAARTLVLQRLAINFQGAQAYRTGEGGTGDVFIEDVVGRWFQFQRQNLWARQFNPEGDGTHVLNDGGRAWILGLKTEGGGTLVETRAGGSTELLGSFSYTVGQGKLAPMFVIEDAEAAITFAEVCFTDDPFATIVRETQGGVTRELTADDPRWRRHLTLYRSAVRHAP